MRNVNVLRFIIKFFRNSKIRFGYLNELGLYNHLSDDKYVRKEWKVNFGTELNLENPKTFNEKLQWLKINIHKAEYTMMVDKYAVKKYVAEKIGSNYIIPTLGVWDSFEKINFDELPQKFVLKCTHDSGGLVICTNKDLLNKKETQLKLTRCLKRKYYYCHREWPYRNVPPKIIAEEYMQDGKNKALTDYKFYCFNGIPQYLYVSIGLNDHSTARMSFLNTDWTFANFGRTDYKPLESLPPKPDKLNEMLEIAKVLSKDIPFLRVDLYEINGQIYFGELTFTPCAGMMAFDPPEADLEVGKMLDISYLISTNAK